MKKLMTIFAFALITAVIAPSCSSDETFEDVVKNSDLDETFTTDDEFDPQDRPGTN